MRMIVRGARLPSGREHAADPHGLSDVEVGEDGRIARVLPHDDQKEPPATGVLIEAHGCLLSAPFVEPHIHLDTALTAGEPRPNASGTLWEGIACWSERKRTLTHEDVVARATEVLRWQAAQGVLHVRTHCDVTDPSLTALDALLEVRDRVRAFMTLQIVAFPQEGIVSFPGGPSLLREALVRGADVVGAIPHFEDTREDGVASLGAAFALAEEFGLRVDAHCDEIDDEQSRFVEVLAALALRSGLRERATASHTTAMGSYNGAYSNKLQRLLVRSGINLVANPFANLNLQGRFDAYPKRRGLTQVKEMLAAGVNVAFGHDDVMDPWNALGTANPLQTALVGLYAAQLTGADDLPAAFSMVTDRAARVLGLDDGEYGIAEGAPASFVLLPAPTPEEAIRRQVRARYVVAHGTVIAQSPPAPTVLHWPGEDPSEVDFTPRPR
ncbi:cytosine deaminase [Streptomyces sp. cmx-4-9]|uniref:cytosine deaminase n=1 Tax=Streptomyces sp. cmx-4-9 TaxID=2790941 RepID=UPI003980C2BF